MRLLTNCETWVINLANEENQVTITQNGRKAAVVIWTEEFKEYEAFLHRQYIKKELAKAKQQALNPNTKWLTEEGFWANFENSLWSQIKFLLTALLFCLVI